MVISDSVFVKECKKGLEWEEVVELVLDLAYSCW